MIKLTTRTDIICPKCKEELKIKSKGLFGGLITQFIMHAAIKAVKAKGGEITCKCGYKFKQKKKLY